MLDGKYDVNSHDDGNLTQEEAILIYNTPIECTMQSPWELSHVISEELVPRKIKSMVEIGTFKGGTLWQWLKCIEDNASFTAIDAYDPAYSFDKGADYYRELFNEWANPKNIDFELIDGDSSDLDILEVIKNKYPEGIDCLFIDGNHLYDYVKNDFVLYGELVKPGGIIVMHDILLSPDVIIFWREIQHAGYKTKQYAIKERPYGIGVVYK
jgi:predicted O-methyltransferase YrrM